MTRALMIAVASAVVLVLSPAAFGQQKSQVGTAEEAKAEGGRDGKG